MARMNKIGSHKTTVYHDSGATCVRYHATELLRVTDSTIVLNSGGYRTVTTKRRINQAMAEWNLPYRVEQVNFNWYVRKLYNGCIAPFEDGMMLDRSSERNDLSESSGIAN